MHRAYHVVFCGVDYGRGVRCQHRARPLATKRRLGRTAAIVLRIPTAAARLGMSRRCEEGRIDASGAANHGQHGNGKQETLHHTFHGFSLGKAWPRAALNPKSSWPDILPALSLTAAADGGKCEGS